MQNRAKTLLRFEDSCPKQHTVICYSTTLINSRNIETHHVHAIHGEFCCLALVLIKGGHSLTIFFKHFCITHSPWVCVGEGGGVLHSETFLICEHINANSRRKTNRRGSGHQQRVFTCMSNHKLESVNINLIGLKIYSLSHHSAQDELRIEDCWKKPNGYISQHINT